MPMLSVSHRNGVTFSKPHSKLSRNCGSSMPPPATLPALVLPVLLLLASEGATAGVGAVAGVSLQGLQRAKSRVREMAWS